MRRGMRSSIPLLLNTSLIEFVYIRRTPPLTPIEGGIKKSFNRFARNSFAFKIGAR